MEALQGEVQNIICLALAVQDLRMKRLSAIPRESAAIQMQKGVCHWTNVLNSKVH